LPAQRHSTTDDAFIVTPVGIGAEIGNLCADIRVGVVQTCRYIGGIYTHEPHEKRLDSIVPFVALVEGNLRMELGGPNIKILHG